MLYSTDLVVNENPNSHYRETEIIGTFLARHMLYFQLTQSPLQYSYSQGKEKSDGGKDYSADISEEEKQHDIEEIKRVMDFNIPQINSKFIDNVFYAHNLKEKNPECE